MMRTTMLGGRETSRIGLGCGRLQGGAGAKAGRRLVEEARKLGIAHFDVAPSYGLGLAEDVLGDVLAGDSSVTIATKVGIARPSNAGLKSLARQLLRPLLVATPALKQRLASEAQKSVPRNQFGPDQIETSFAESLRRLRREHVDALLLHQPEPGSIGAETAAAMERLVADGRAGAVGSGTGNDLAALVPFGTVRQYRWSPAVTPQAGTTDIVHGLLRRYPRFADPSTDFSQRLAVLGFDAADPAAWPGLLLTVALASAPDLIVLVSSSTPTRLHQAVAAIDWTAVEGGKPGFIEDASALLDTLTV
ncbi:putative oxidoreductase, aryl-alcohol dehydrogenase like protein [Novosphingobium sp. AP12]|nr:putative oxidoreductase, aryl-alcohol dehydrogenase like protein [Novosphingobium sp. AP12]